MELKSILDEAAREGLISAEASGRLLPFLLERGVTAQEQRLADETAEPDVVWSDTETPRFVRGFHDVLITIGIVVLLAGLWGLASIYAVLPVIVVLSEILVRRQRLALPAIALTVALFCWTAAFMTLWYPQEDDFWLAANRALGFIAAFPVVLGLYYLRYRVPLSLALAIMSALGLLLALLVRLLQWGSGDALFLVNHPGILSAIFVACALGLFAVALRFDLRDRLRRTTRSDIAFWLHLGAAPALLYSIIALFSLQGGWTDVMETVSVRTPVVVITVALLMLVGIVIDRRAFVTSGLLSLGAAIYGIFRQGSATVDTYIFTTLIVVGLIVLVIGTGWMPLRRMVLKSLPPALSERLPPA
jgi:hypothetical protein